MTAAVIATSSAALLAALIAVGLFIAGEIRRSRNAKAEQRRQLVTRMLHVIDGVILHQTKPPLLRGLKSPDVDIALALPRLLLDLEKTDLLVSSWVWAQTQRLSTTTDKAAYVKRAANIEGRLVSWHRRDIDTEWFEKDLVREPVIEGFAVPRRTPWVRAIKMIPDNVLSVGSLVVAGYVLKRLFRS